MKFCARLSHCLTVLHSVLEARFTPVDNRFSQVMSDASKVDDVHSGDVSQDVLTVPFAVPSVVAGRSQLVTDRAPFAQCSVGLGITLGGLVTIDEFAGNSSSSRLSFEDLFFTLRVLELSGGSVSDAFLASLCDKVEYSTEHSFVISGDLIADLVVSFCARTLDPVNPLPDSSKEWDSVIPFLCNIVGVSASCLPSVVGTGCSAGVSGSVSALPNPPLGFANLPSVASSLPTPPPVSSALILPSFSGLVPPPALSAPVLPSFSGLVPPPALSAPVLPSFSGFVPRTALPSSSFTSPLPSFYPGVPSSTDSVDGTSGASFDFADPLHFRDGDDPYDKGAVESHPLGRATHSQAFREVVSLIMGFFSCCQTC